MANPLTPPNIHSLPRSLSPTARPLLETACSAADQRGLELWAVGGTVRDAATGHRLLDLDLAVDRDAGALAIAVASATGGSLDSEARFGTASVVVGSERLDLATLRAERYEEPGALPAVSLGAPIELDLERRDFSVNAIALGLTGPRRGEILDPFDGLAHLAAGRFELLHHRSFEDDATRLWRAARLSAHRDLRPTSSTRVSILEGSRWLDAISGDRLWSEFALIAERGRAGRTLALLEEWHVLEATSEALALSDASRDALRHRWRPLSTNRLAAVLLATREPDAARAALARLNAPSAASRAVSDARSLLATGDPDPERLEALTDSGEDARGAARWLNAEQADLQRELQRWGRTRPHLAPRELIAIGIEEGPTLGAWLGCLRRGRYLGTLGSAAEARMLVRRHLDRPEVSP